MRRALLALVVAFGLLGALAVPASAATPVSPSWYITDARCVFVDGGYVTLGAYVNVVQVTGLNVKLDGALVTYQGGSATIDLATGKHLFVYSAKPGYVVNVAKRAPFRIDPAPAPCGPA